MMGLRKLRFISSKQIHALSFVIIYLFCVPSVNAQSPSIIALFGDSISVGRLPGFGGFGTSTQAGLGNVNFGQPDKLLSSVLNNSNRPSVVVNWGFSASPTGDSPTLGFQATAGVNRISSNLAQTKSQLNGSEYYVLILYGTNDFNYGISSDNTAFNIAVMIDRARAQGFIPVIATLTPRDDQLSQVLVRNPKIISAASGRGAAVVDQYSIFNNAGGFNLLWDGVHPNQTGYAVIANGWFSYLSQIIPEFGQSNIVITPLIQLLMDD